MPSLSRCRKSAQLSRIAKQVYGPTQVTPWRSAATRLVAVPPAPVVPAAQVVVQQDTDGTAYLLRDDGVGCSLRLAPDAVAFVRSLLS